MGNQYQAYLKIGSPRSYSSTSATHITIGIHYLISSRESYSYDCACSRNDFTTQTAVFFQLLLFDNLVKEKNI